MLNRRSSENQVVQTNDSTFAIRLINSGFLLYADSLAIDSLKGEMKKSFYIYNEKNNKIIDVDAEELAEFNFNHFLPQLNVILAKRNFQLEVKTADDYETTNEVLLNGVKIQLYSNEQLESDEFWNIAARNFFKKLNELLKEKNINETFFLLYGGNDLNAFLLTEKQYSIISEKYKSETSEIPYRP